MSFNKNKAFDIYKVKFSDIETEQSVEIQKIMEDFSQRNAGHSGMHLKAHSDVYKKHLKVKAEYLINAFLESFPEDERLDAKTENELNRELSEFIDSQYRFTNNSLTQLMHATGMYRAGISTIQSSNLRSHFNEIKNIKLKQMKHLIEKHNRNALQNKKRESFWSTKNGMITAIGTIIIALTGVVVLLINLGIFTKVNSNIEIPSIDKFEIIPPQIKIGSSADLIWQVSHSDSIIINNKIGMVPFVGSKKIFPLRTTSYRLSAFLYNKELSINQKIIVVDSLNHILK